MYASVNWGKTKKGMRAVNPLLLKRSIYFVVVVLLAVDELPACPPPLANTRQSATLGH